MTEAQRTYDHGNREEALDGEILRGLVGSNAHGLAVSGTDDEDVMGVFVERPARVIGTTTPMDHFISRTQPEGMRSGHGDVDITMYSLRKYLRLALAGNPSILVLLYTPTLYTTTPLGDELRQLTPKIVSMYAAHRFLGYLVGQRDRMVGLGKQNRVPNRPELVEKYGYDTKYAAHALRLGYQGIELITKGYLTLPMTDHLDTLLAVRLGKVSFPTALALIDYQREVLRDLIFNGISPLPERPDTTAVNHWSIDAHLRLWQDRRMI